MTQSLYYCLWYAGCVHFGEVRRLWNLVLRFAEEQKPIAAICAAPMVLGKLGLLKGKKATCYPGFEQYLEGAECTGAPVERDGNIITGKGPGAAMEFASGGSGAVARQRKGAGTERSDAIMDL